MGHGGAGAHDIIHRVIAADNTVGEAGAAREVFAGDAVGAFELPGLTDADRRRKLCHIGLLEARHVGAQELRQLVAATAAFLGRPGHGHRVDAVDPAHVHRIAEHVTSVKALHQVELGQIRVQAAFGDAALGEPREIGVRLGEGPVPVHPEHMEGNRHPHHVPLRVTKDVGHPGLGRDIAIARTVDDHLRLEGKAAVAVEALDPLNPPACGVHNRLQRGRVEPQRHPGLFEHLEHGQGGNVVIVDDFRAEVLERAGTLFSRWRVQGGEPLGQLLQHATDDGIDRIAPTPRHAGAECHDAADLGRGLEQHGSQALATGGYRSAETGGATTDNQNVCFFDRMTGIACRHCHCPNPQPSGISA
ncbi:MAG: Uncharacterised protein [Rhodospirillaceae bacterium]|nr:MAG: Uncharacterised protein [Rhodospirillaceae bacterium]